MSIKITSWVWKNGPTDQGELLVLLALADFANEDGVCWPSMASIATKARLTERGAQKIVRRLEANGRLSIDTGGGRHGCNTYRINTDPPEPGTPNTVHPEHGSPRTTEQKPRTRVQKTPNPGSPEPSGTIKNRQSSRVRAREAASPENEASQRVTCASPSATPDQLNRERLLAAMGVRDGASR